MKKEYLNNPDYIELDALKLEEQAAKKVYNEAKEKLNKLYEEISSIEISITILETKHCFTKKKRKEKTLKLEKLKEQLEKKRNQTYQAHDDFATSLINYTTISNKLTEKEKEIQNKYIKPCAREHYEGRNNSKIKALVMKRF